LKQWVHKLLEQFDFDWGMTNKNKQSQLPVDLSEERATLLYFLDTYNKHLMEMEKYPVRRVREELDEFAKLLVHPEHMAHSEKALFRLRQWFSTYRIEEHSYVHKTFDDFKNIIWDFIDQLADDFAYEKNHDQNIRSSLEELKDAVESNSIDQLKTKSREFVDNYIEFQSRRDANKSKRMIEMKKNLNIVKKQLIEANHSMRRDHLTGAFNRMSFDEQMKTLLKYRSHTQQNLTMIMLDIDHFKKVNDTYGHDIGDFVLKECVRVIQEKFNRPMDFVARIGGEEFAIILPDYKMEHAVIKADELLTKIRNDVYIIEDKQIKFTISCGIAEVSEKETAEQWLKRADEALYHSKNTGRDRYTIAAPNKKLTSVA
jgi:diguanylate cyclase